MRQLNLKRLAIIPVAAITLVALAACSDPNEASVEQRRTVMSRAEQAAPIVEPSNFPQRKALVKMTERQDAINHPWYIYILGMGGEYVGYFVGQTYPINSCNFLSGSEDIVWSSNGNLTIAAPSLDGMFYGGAGGSSACDTYFFFDVETDAMQTFKAPMFFASDSPLDLDVPRLNNTKAVE